MQLSPCRVRTTVSCSFPRLKQQQISCFPFKKLSNSFNMACKPCKVLSACLPTQSPIAPLRPRSPPSSNSALSVPQTELVPLPEPLHLLSLRSLERSCPHLYPCDSSNSRQSSSQLDSIPVSNILSLISPQGWLFRFSVFYFYN